LPETLPAPGRSVILHGDYRIDNMLFDGDGTLTAVLDWELATLGDPLADFSYLAMQWMLPASGGSGLAGLDLKALGIPSLKVVAARYSKRSGLPVSSQLDWYFAFHLFRLAVAEQGASKRVPSAESAGQINRVAMLAKAAWTFAKRAGA
jgi:aminoglycoside phosphotransferase (APT) family kinase protein